MTGKTIRHALLGLLVLIVLALAGASYRSGSQRLQGTEERIEHLTAELSELERETVALRREIARLRLERRPIPQPATTSGETP